MMKETWQNFAGAVDRGGMPAWLAVSILGWIVFWPIGIFLTVNMFMRKGNYMCNQERRCGARSTGNSAFDQYRKETLDRLEEERQAFSDYLQRLRDARDKEEFDGWMKELRGSKTAKA